MADLVGDDVLMYASDYPHGESHFPETVGMALAWKMDEQRRRKLMWDNAVRLYARAGLAALPGAVMLKATKRPPGCSS